MLTVHESHTGSGLLVAEQSVTDGDVAAALRMYEPSLRLVPQRDGAERCVRWCVFRYLGNDRDAEFVCAWADERGTPLPLSMGLLEKVRQLDVRTRGGPADPNLLNEQHVARHHRESLAEKESIAEDYAPYLDRGRLSVSLTDSERHHRRPFEPRRECE